MNRNLIENILLEYIINPSSADLNVNVSSRWTETDESFSRTDFESINVGDAMSIKSGAEMMMDYQWRQGRKISPTNESIIVGFLPPF
jgi:hypothetical protein